MRYSGILLYVRIENLFQLFTDIFIVFREPVPMKKRKEEEKEGQEEEEEEEEEAVEEKAWRKTGIEKELRKKLAEVEEKVCLQQRKVEVVVMVKE